MGHSILSDISLLFLLIAFSAFVTSQPPPFQRPFREGVGSGPFGRPPSPPFGTNVDVSVSESSSSECRGENGMMQDGYPGENYGGNFGWGNGGQFPAADGPAAGGNGQGRDIDVEMEESFEEKKRRRKRQSPFGGMVRKIKHFFGANSQGSSESDGTAANVPFEQPPQQKDRSKRNFLNPLMMSPGTSQYGSMYPPSPYQSNSDYASNRQNNFGFPNNRQNNFDYPNYQQQQQGLPFFPLNSQQNSMDPSNYNPQQQYLANSYDPTQLQQQQQQQQQQLMGMLMGMGMGMGAQQPQQQPQQPPQPQQPFGGGMQ